MDEARPDGAEQPREEQFAGSPPEQGLEGLDPNQQITITVGELREMLEQTHPEALPSRLMVGVAASVFLPSAAAASVAAGRPPSPEEAVGAFSAQTLALLDVIHFDDALAKMADKEGALSHLPPWVIVLVGLGVTGFSAFMTRRALMPAKPKRQAAEQHDAQPAEEAQT